ncbi:FtsW/RodA/SpoVE family cell cycle protein [Glycomyces buryatensis]|uniref:FtsW/RodA/SpoVE family cell cycle protein n=1 Tax=Glycomyces buryatensis TaxID=2570927 RepID=A0A4S8PRP9_9ACTN|nr:FtsW/RodA/SpoVE family cell cycle protein [Glycomyces buryatensis]THV33927.1 FtsW/RodA/SpoVE family cell cycle protein [Glycomyces buryatensis]
MAQPMSATAKPAGPSEPPLTPLSGMPKRVGRQITMLIIAYIATLSFQITIDLALISKTNSVTFMLPTIIFLASLGAWTITRFLAPYADPLLIPIASFITGIGIVFIRRLDRSATTVDPLPADAGIFAGQGGRQLMYFIAGVVLLGILLAVVRDHRVLRSYSYILLFTGIFIAALPGFLPYSISGSDGSKNWIRLGGFSIQPSEFAKLMLLIFFAVYLVRKRDMLAVAGPKFLGMQFPRMKDLGPILIVWAASIGLLVLEKDLGTSLLLFGMFLSMLYMATRRASWILIGLTLFMGACIAIYPFMGHLQTRVLIWLDPWNPTYVWPPPEGGPSSYQLVQGLSALNAGGLLGNGPGAGNPNLIPASESDFILAAFGEETGLVGLLGLLLLYAILVERSFKTGIMCRDLFGKLMAGGIAFLIALQLFVVAGGVTGLIPMTGLTTVFMAAGGSSLVASWLMLGLLIRVSNDARKPWQVSYGLQKTEAPAEFLAEQAARKAAEEAATAGVAADGPLPGGDQPTELIIPAAMQGGGTVAPTSGPPAPNGGPTLQSPPNGPPPGPPHPNGGPPPGPGGPTTQQPNQPGQAPGNPGSTAQAPSPPPPPLSAFEYRPQPPAYGPDKKEGEQ